MPPSVCLIGSAGAFITRILTPEALDSWGWRVAFRVRKHAQSHRALRVARARAAKTGCLVQLPRQTAHRIFAGERWTTLHGVNADFCHALAPLGEFFANSKISRLI